AGVISICFGWCGHHRLRRDVYHDTVLLTGSGECCGERFAGTGQDVHQLLHSHDDQLCDQRRLDSPDERDDLHRGLECPTMKRRLLIFASCLLASHMYAQTVGNGVTVGTGVNFGGTVTTPPPPPTGIVFTPPTGTYTGTQNE